MTRFLATAFLVLLAVPASAGTTTGFSFLDLPAGARIAALGGAGATLAEGPNALFWNPAGLAPDDAASAPHGQATFDHHESILGFRQELVGGVLRKGADALGVGLNAHYTEGIEERDALGNLVGTFGATDLAVAFGVAKTAAPGLRLGGALQWAHESLGGDGASALGVSAGGIYALPGTKGLVLGAAVRNVGKSPRFKTQDGADGSKVPQ